MQGLVNIFIAAAMVSVLVFTIDWLFVPDRSVKTVNKTQTSVPDTVYDTIYIPVPAEKLDTTIHKTVVVNINVNE